MITRYLEGPRADGRCLYEDTQIPGGVWLFPVGQLRELLPAIVAPTLAEMRDGYVDRLGIRHPAVWE